MMGPDPCHNRPNAPSLRLIPEGEYPETLTGRRIFSFGGAPQEAPQMESYNAKSCHALSKPFYHPIEAALRWCGLIDREAEIIEKIGYGCIPTIRDFPQWPCLRINTEKIFDALINGEMPCGRFGQAVNPDEQVAAAKKTVRHTELKAWMTKHEPGQKPAFLFDEVERGTHAAINVDAFRALQVDRDATRAELEKFRQRAESTLREMEAMRGERDSLRAMVDKQVAPNQKAETTYLNIIGGLLDLMLGTTPGGQKGSAYVSQAAIISALLAHQGGKPGIAVSTLEQKFAEAKRSIKAT